MNLPYIYVSTIICGLILAFFWKAFLYLRTITKYWKVRNVEYVKTRLLFGNFLKVLVWRDNFVINVKYLYDAINGPFGGIYLFTRPVLMVRDPELIKRVLFTDANKFTGYGLLTNNLLMLQGAQWSGINKSIPARFHRNMQKRLFDVMKKGCTTLQEHVERGGQINCVLNARQLINQLTIDMTASIVYSIEIDSSKDRQGPFGKIGRLLGNSTRIGQLRSLLAITLPSIVDYFDIGKMNPELEKMFRKVTDDSLKLRELNNIVHFDYMQIITQFRNCGQLSDNGKWDTCNKTDKHLTDDEIFAKAFLFFAFVFETASSTALFALLELTKNKEIQRNLQFEIDQALKNSIDVRHGVIQSIKYLDQVCNETLRKYPPMPIVARSVAKQFKLTNTDIVLEENQLVFVPIYAVHHDSKYYVRPNEFNPDRFSSDEIKKRIPDTFYPYGKHYNVKDVRVTYATLQAKMSIVAFCSKFDLDLAPDHDPGNGRDNFNFRLTKRK